MNDYSEDTLVGRPAIALLSELGYFVFLDAVSNVQFRQFEGLHGQDRILPSITQKPKNPGVSFG
jgi:hypothetical protein